MASMLGDNDLRSVLQHIRFIASECFDLKAVERLRVLADQIEQKMRAPKVVLTGHGNSGDQGGATPI
jgi:hypothetical protein